eukprot:6212381-Pleurochrysis_carterae.AAC.3
MSQKDTMYQRKTLHKKAVLLVKQSLHHYEVCTTASLASQPQSLRSCTLAVAYLFAARSLVGDLELCTMTQLDIEALHEAMILKEMELLEHGPERKQDDAKIVPAWRIF